MLLLFILLLAYLIGSIPTAYLIARFHHVNIFDEGSGNMGASNISRVLGVRWGILTFTVDVIKGVIAVGLMIMLMSYDPILISLAAAASICGHSWSILATILAYDKETGFKIRGGKGAATGFGSFFWIAPIYVIVVMIAVIVLVVAVTRTFSIAAIVSWMVGFLWLLFSILTGKLEAIWWVYILVTTLLVVVRILGNLQRLFSGTERKLER